MEENIAETMNGKLNEAIIYATQKHTGQKRKGTNISYIVHPLETMSILANMNADVTLLIAGVLHDVVEDTDATIEQVKEKFGSDVAELVGSHSEDKTKTWKERKEKDISETANGTRNLKMLVMADKVSNLRSLYNAMKETGEQVWTHFHAPVQMQAWYYSKMIDALDDLQYDTDTAEIYWEMVGLFKDIFVTYYYNPHVDTIYQICVTGENYYFTSDNAAWQEFTDELPENSEQINRKIAERMESNWAEAFDAVIADDIKDSEYKLYSSTNRSLSIILQDKKLTFYGEDRGRECELISGRDEYEFAYELDEEQTYKLICTLRMQNAWQHSVEEIFMQEFGFEDGSVRFERYCTVADIDYYFLSL